MSNKKNDSYIDYYFDDEEIAPVVTNRALLEPLIWDLVFHLETSKTALVKSFIGE